jgi:hypothetical protein
MVAFTASVLGVQVVFSSVFPSLVADTVGK